jgi:hypothetical protein
MRAKINYQNKNFIEGELIHNIYIGNQTGATLMQTHLELDHLTARIRHKGKPVLILVDLSELGKVTLEARKVGLILMRDLDFDKAALFGNYYLLQGLVEAISLAAGRKFKVKLFTTKTEAKAWLLTKQRF